MRYQDIVLKKMLDQLLELCMTELELDELPHVNLIKNESSIEGSSFGLFDGDVNVVSRGRHPVDVMRTVAHELVHWKQRTQGQDMDGSDGSDTENQANAIAGAIMRKFGKMHPEYFNLGN